MPQIELLHTDCMEYMRGLPDKAFDLAIVDPPYGLRWRTDTEKRTIVSLAQGRRAKRWDVRPASDYWTELFRVSVNQCVFGAENFADILPLRRSYFVWDKCRRGTYFSDCELVWTSFSTVSRYATGGRIFSATSNDLRRIHICQKPVVLYRWILQNYAKPGQRILDTHLGSGSIAIACDIEGFDLVGCEIDADYIKAAQHRLAVHQSAPSLFEATPAGLPQQLSLGDDVLPDGT